MQTNLKSAADATPAATTSSGLAEEKPSGERLEVGYYSPTDDFRAITEHIALMRPYGGIVALLGPASDPQSLVDAHFFKAVHALYDACQLALAIHGGHSPTVDEALEEALARAGMPVAGSRGCFTYVPGGETIHRLLAEDSKTFAHVDSFSEDPGGEITHIVRRRLSDDKLFEFLDWAGHDHSREVRSIRNAH